MDNPHVCVFCGNTGSRGALWVLEVGGNTNRVHKPCGETLAKHAPEGVSTKLVPSRELRSEWRAEREQREARAFWEKKFAQAAPLRTR